MTTFLEYRNRKKTTEEINEKLLPKEESDAHRMMESGHSYYRERFLRTQPKAYAAFTQHPDTKQWSHRIPVSLTESSEVPHEDVTSFLRRHNYTVTPENYKSGIVTQTTKVGDESKGIPIREKVISHKIGGLLEKHDASDYLKKSYTNDTYRNGAKTKNYDIILTGHPTDIYGGSTGRGWVSCANKRKGEEKFNGNGLAARALPAEINNHTHMAYLVPRGGNIDTDAIGRMSFKHHTGLISGHQTILPEGIVYGTPPTAFAHVAKKVVSDLFEKKDEPYRKDSLVYNDNGQDFDFPEHMTPDHVDAAWKSLGQREIKQKQKLYAYVDPSVKYKSRELNDVGKSIQSIKDANMTGDFTKINTAVKKAEYSISENGHYPVVDNNHHMSDALDEGAKHFDINNPEHVQSLSEKAKYNKYIGRSFIRKTLGTIEPVKTLNQYHAMSNLIDAGIFHSKIPIDNKHEMGKNPFDSIVSSLSEKGALNERSYARAYSTTYGKNKRHGNIYDHAVHHENSGVPGMSSVVDSLANNMNSENSSMFSKRFSKLDDQALSYHLMKPETRHRISSVLGEDHVKIMRNNRKAIDANKESMKNIADIISKNKLDGNE